MAKSILFLAVFIFSNFAVAASPKVSDLVNGYYQQKALWAVMLKKPQNSLPRPLPDPSEDEPSVPPPRRNPNPGPIDCRPAPGDCVEAVCQQLSRFDCDDRDDLLDIANECRNVSADCVKSVCSRVSRFACDEKSEMFEVTGMCRGLFDVSCIDYVCSRISRFDCDELSELHDIARQCR
ncbi:hypothetical protein ACES2L_06815 [Bdellovibrio bacteriovorus]